jgi:hypothetical protein
VGTNDPTTTASLALQYTNVTADPIRPYIYVTKGGTNIDIYNIYTRALVGTISSAGNSLGQIKISSDGSFLYVLDVGSAEIVRINLDDPTLRTHWPFAGYVFTYARPMGHPSLILDSGALVDANNGHVTAAFPPIFYGTGELNASQDGTRFCGIDSGLSPYSIYCYDLAYSSLNGGQYRATATNNYWAGSVGSNGKDVALNANGSKLYAAGGAPYAFAEYSLPSVQFTQYLNGDAYPNCIEISDDGTIFGGIAGYYGPKDLWIYNSDGSLRKSAYLSGYAQTIVDRQLTVSGESLMAIVLTTDPAIVFLRAD